MAFDAKKPALWHAFDALDDQHSGNCIKSKLKVLTHNLATCLGVLKAEEGLDQYCAETTMSFKDFTLFLKLHVFDKIQDSDELNCNANWDKIDEVCWMLCARKYLNRDSGVLSDNDIYRLWRVFNFLCEPDTDGELLYPVVMDTEEVILLVEQLCSVLHKVSDLTPLEEQLQNTFHLQFSQTLSILEEHCCGDTDPEPVKMAIQELYDDYVADVVKKGYLLKKGPKMTMWKERWFVLTPKKVSYYTSRDEKELKGNCVLSTNCSIQVLPDKTGAKLNRFQLKSGERDYELASHDVRSRVEWITAFKNAIEQNSKPMSWQKAALQRRRAAREQKREKRRLEEQIRKSELELAEKTRQLLLAEQQARAEAEARLETEQRAKEAEAQRFRELQEVQKQLEILLEEERQAKRDEEIVRNLQARILEEQFQKSEELEELKAQMELELQEEKRKRESLESLRRQQEQLLAKEQSLLVQLEEERRANDRRLQEALEKLQAAEESKSELQEKIQAAQAHKSKTSRSMSMEPSGPKYVTHRGLGAFPEPYKGSYNRSISVDANKVCNTDIPNRDKL